MYIRQGPASLRMSLRSKVVAASKDKVLPSRGRAWTLWQLKHAEAHQAVAQETSGTANKVSG